MKYFEKRKLKKFLSKIENNNFSNEYLEYHKYKIDCLKWLISYYEGCTAGSPKEYFESILNDLENTYREGDADRLKVLYYWIYYKRIVGF